MIFLATCLPSATSSKMLRSIGTLSRGDETEHKKGRESLRESLRDRAGLFLFPVIPPSHHCIASRECRPQTKRKARCSMRCNGQVQRCSGASVNIQKRSGSMRIDDAIAVAVLLECCVRSYPTTFCFVRSTHSRIEREKEPETRRNTAHSNCDLPKPTGLSKPSCMNTAQGGQQNFKRHGGGGAPGVGICKIVCVGGWGREGGRRGKARRTFVTQVIQQWWRKEDERTAIFLEVCNLG